MKIARTLKGVLLTLAAATVVALCLAADQPVRPTEPPASRPALPLEFGRKLPLSLASSGVEWRGNTYHLLKLDSVRFDLDRASGALKASVHGANTSFDDVDYDVSAAVFGADGELLGTARARCRVRRIWLGNLELTDQTVDLDFGVSLEYPRAKTFMIGISKRNVLTPDQWQK